MKQATSYKIPVERQDNIFKKKINELGKDNTQIDHLTQ